MVSIPFCGEYRTNGIGDPPPLKVGGIWRVFTIEGGYSPHCASFVVPGLSHAASQILTMTPKKVAKFCFNQIRPTKRVHLANFLSSLGVSFCCDTCVSGFLLGFPSKQAHKGGTLPPINVKPDKKSVLDPVRFHIDARLPPKEEPHPSPDCFTRDTARGTPRGEYSHGPGEGRGAGGKHRQQPADEVRPGGR